MLTNSPRIIGSWIIVFGISTHCLAVDLVEVARFNLFDTAADEMSPTYIGSNPSAVAWTGSRLLVAGFNNNASLGDAGIIEVLNANATGVVDAPTFSDRLQTLLTSAFRGYISMDASADGSALAVAYDLGSGGSAEGFQVFNASDGSLRWDFNARGSSGAAFDPGFGGADSGVAFGAFGSGRRILHDANSGAQIYDTTNGMIWYDNMGPGTFVRDMDFDPETGDIYVRHNNQLSKATRTAGNDASPQGIIFPLGEGEFVSHQNVSFLHNTSDGDLLIFNDRETSGAGKEFLNTILVADTSGTSVAANFTFLNGEVPASSSGWYDFDFDPVSQTLAILDNSNRFAHIFEVGGDVEVDCDFNGDTVCDGTDIDLLVENIAIGPPDPTTYDLNGDDAVDVADRDEWLALAGARNLASGNPYLIGDANLDGIVDGLDFIDWNTNKFTSVAAWTAGDFTADGIVDGLDFIDWNTNKFMSADAATVPEPSTTLLLLASLFFATSMARSLPS